MSDNKPVLGLVGSPNKAGRTYQLVSAALEGAAKAGANVELVQMSDHVVLACRDCLPWVCQTNRKCTYEDEGLDYLSQKILNCGGLILGTPVYWGDTSGMVKYLILKMFRIYARSGLLHGLPAFGIAIAGGSGNGLISGLRQAYHFFHINRMRAIAPLPVTRFDFMQAEERAAASGRQIAEMVGNCKPFASRDECVLWYDRLPYLGANRSGERRLLAAIAAEAVSGERRADIDGDLGQADILAASGRELEAVIEATRVYESSVKIIDNK
jgi:multimeric flavodoxin WrbA